MVSCLRTLTIDPNQRPITVSIAGRLTCLCPVNERRDYATVEVTYHPTHSVVELESFAQYLGGWSETQAAHDLVAQEIAQDVYDATEADDVTVRTRWEAVEGIECVVVASR